MALLAHRAAWLDNGLALMLFPLRCPGPVVSVVHRSLWDKLDTCGGLDPAENSDAAFIYARQRRAAGVRRGNA